MAEFKNWTGQIQVIGDNSTFDDNITFYNKQNNDGNVILGVKLDNGNIVLFASSNGVEGTELKKFTYSSVTIPTSTSATDLIEQLHTYIYNGDSVVGGAPIRDISATDTFLTTDYTLNATGTYTVNLPTAVGIKSKIYVIKNSGVGTITVDADGTETIEGSLTLTVLTTEAYTMQSDGANWIVI